MTDVNLGGRPRTYDEDELVGRIETLEDLRLVEKALIENSSHPTWAPGCADWLGRLKSGVPNGGKSRKMVYCYRRMLAELDFDPLRPPGGRRKALRELRSELGSAQFALIMGGALAGATALAAQTGSMPLWALALAGPPIMHVMSSCPDPRRQASLPL